MIILMQPLMLKKLTPSMFPTMCCLQKGTFLAINFLRISNNNFEDKNFTLGFNQRSLKN